MQTLLGRAQALDALEALAFRNTREMKRRRFPALYESGVRYRTSPGDRRHWKTASQVLGDRHGDCADLAAWRVAELRRQGKRATFHIKSTSRPGLYHIQVLTRRGVEDPSRRLGMRGDGQ